MSPGTHSFKYSRVTRQLPCPVCGHDGWCLVSRTGDAAVCCRVESPREASAFSGWYHDIPVHKRHLPATIKQYARAAHAHPLKDFEGELATYERAFTAAARAHAAETLGLDASVFDAYRIGYHAESDALALPAMQLDDPVICGIRFRSLRPTGQKWWTAAGSTAGVLIPTRAPKDGEPLLLTEGPSDGLAATQVGLHAIARWSCTLDRRHLDTVELYLRQLSCPEVMVVGDNDAAGTGQRGADGAAAAIAKQVPDACVMRIQPPDGIKDLREWVRAGATAGDILGAAKEVARGN